MSQTYTKQEEGLTQAQQLARDVKELEQMGWLRQACNLERQAALKQAQQYGYSQTSVRRLAKAMYKRAGSDRASGRQLEWCSYEAFTTEKIAVNQECWLSRRAVKEVEKCARCFQANNLKEVRFECEKQTFDDDCCDNRKTQLVPLACYPFGLPSAAIEKVKDLQKEEVFDTFYVFGRQMIFEAFGEEKPKQTALLGTMTRLTHEHPESDMLVRVLRPLEISLIQWLDE